MPEVPSQGQGMLLGQLKQRSLQKIHVQKHYDDGIMKKPKPSQCMPVLGR